MFKLLSCDEDFPWNKVYKYSRRNIRKSVAMERGLSIHQKINMNYRLSSQNRHLSARDEYSRREGRAVRMYETPFRRDIFFEGICRNDRNEIPLRKDRCEVCMVKASQPIHSSYNAFGYAQNETLLCVKCRRLRHRYKSRTDDDTIEGWLSWSLSSNTAFRRYIKSLPPSQGRHTTEV